jgi:hypothetical protein
LSNNFKLIKSEKDSDKNTVFFYFNISEHEDVKNKLLDDYTNQICMVNTKIFTWAIKTLKNELYKHKNYGGNM